MYSLISYFMSTMREIILNQKVVYHALEIVLYLLLWSMYFAKLEKIHRNHLPGGSMIYSVVILRSRKLGVSGFRNLVSMTKNNPY